jgi:hypothetical protein
MGIEGSAVFLERDSTYFKATSDGGTLLARPYINALNDSPQAEIITGPTQAGSRNGGFNGYSRIELFDEEANAMFRLICLRQLSVELLTGAHFLQMRDRLDLTAAGRILPDETILLGETDHYRVDNRFYGAQVGLRGEYCRGLWFINLRGTIALGGDEEMLRTFGDRVFNSPTARIVQPFGLYVLPSNTGTYTRTDFDVVSEVGLNAGCQLTRHLRAFTGYTFLFWNNPIRAGDQVDLTINPTQLTGALAGAARPAIPFRTDSFWAQGVNVGLELCW